MGLSTHRAVGDLFGNVARAVMKKKGTDLEAKSGKRYDQLVGWHDRDEDGYHDVPYAAIAEDAGDRNGRRRLDDYFAIHN